jgi:ABC-2 type transport system ATP-binding protein
VLDIPALFLDKGIYWFKGVNGAGKTTLIKSIAGLIPFEGEVLIGDFPIRQQRAEYLKIINYAEAEPLYPSFLTGNDLLNFYFNTKGGDRRSAERLINAFGMGPYLKNEVGTYSSGMAKKLSLLLAFVGHPALILLDEPFITLDADAVDFLHQHISEIYSSGVSLCISSHQPLAINEPFRTLHIHDQKAELL